MDGLARIPTIGIFCLFLRLKEPVTPFFWVNANDPRVRDLAERMVKKQASEIAEYDARWEALGFG